MSEFQYKSYLSATYSENNIVRGAFRNVDILNLPSDFFLGPRMISNVAFPNKSVGMNGFRSLTKEAMMIQNIKNLFNKILSNL